MRMGPERSLRIEQLGIFHIFEFLVLCRHHSYELCDLYCPFHLSLFFHAQTRDVRSEDSSRERTLKLGQESGVFVIRLYVVFAKDAHFLLSLVRVLHINRSVVWCVSFRQQYRIEYAAIDECRETSLRWL